MVTFVNLLGEGDVPHFYDVVKYAQEKGVEWTPALQKLYDDLDEVQGAGRQKLSYSEDGRDICMLRLDTHKSFVGKALRANKLITSSVARAWKADPVLDPDDVVEVEFSDKQTSQTQPESESESESESEPEAAPQPVSRKRNCREELLTDVFTARKQLKLIGEAMTCIERVEKLFPFSVDGGLKNFTVQGDELLINNGNVKFNPDAWVGRLIKEKAIKAIETAALGCSDCRSFELIEARTAAEAETHVLQLNWTVSDRVRHLGFTTEDIPKDAYSTISKRASATVVRELGRAPCYVSRFSEGRYRASVIFVGDREVCILDRKIREWREQ